MLSTVRKKEIWKGSGSNFGKWPIGWLLTKHKSISSYLSLHLIHSKSHFLWEIFFSSVFISVDEYYKATTKQYLAFFALWRLQLLLGSFLVYHDIIESVFIEENPGHNIWIKFSLQPEGTLDYSLRKGSINVHTCILPFPKHSTDEVYELAKFVYVILYNR
jgi:hypothetical protein